MVNQLKNELHNIISGACEVRFGTVIQAIAGYLSNGEKPGRAIEDPKHFKEQEEQRLSEYLSLNDLWIDTVDLSQYVSEGAEQKVYLNGSEHVLKLNDAIYYSSWKDYLYNLTLHNYFFSDTAYELLGFTKHDHTIYAVVQQAFVSSTEDTDLASVKAFMAANGFENNRNNDYINRDVGIILEDLHDENVLTQNSVLYFIDTVFYLTDNFWQDAM
ncbi:putative polyvalent protein kinase domain-containing protein [Flavobacterium sp.]|uniref:putative polyvalent protein kinase domain-containing protein n=1 Tax=Flavobacterium sp. TaxID=239 RepID=UPI004034ECA4